MRFKKVREVIYQLQTCKILDPSLQDHALAGDFKAFRECHIYGDLVIIYKRDETTLTLFSLRIVYPFELNLRLK